MRRDESLRTLFSEADLDRLEQAIARAEERSRIEVVPFVLRACDAYEHGAWKAMALGLVAGYAIEAGSHALGMWPKAGLWPAATAFVFVLAFALIPGFRRRVIGKKRMDDRAWQKAREIFLSQNLFRTHQRNAILILISLFEREVVVLADEGVYKQVPSEAWRDLSDRLASGMRQARPIETFIQAIEGLSKLESSQDQRKNHGNELSDDLRTGERL